jgi:hypothetical protein
MGGGPTEQVSPPDEFSCHRRPPKRHPDGDYEKNGDLGVTSGSSNHSVRNREFPLREVDRGVSFGFTSGGRTQIEISGIFAGRETILEYAARRKWKGVAAGREAMHVCGAAGSVKSRPHKENILPTLLSPKWKIADERNKEATIWEKIKTRAALAEYGRYIYIFQCYPPSQQLLER